jgi:hypothetical protein
MAVVGKTTKTLADVDEQKKNENKSINLLFQHLNL